MDIFELLGVQLHFTTNLYKILDSEKNSGIAHGS